MTGEGWHANAHEQHYDQRHHPQGGSHQCQALLPAMQQRCPVACGQSALQLLYKILFGGLAYSAVRQTDRAAD